MQKRTSTRGRVVIVFIILAVLAALAGPLFGPPLVLRYPVAVIELVMFDGLDVGHAEMQEVRRLFELKEISRESFWSDSTRPFPEGLEHASFFEAHLGEYQGLPWRVDVLAFFAFSDRGQLRFAEVRKEYDAL